VSKATNLKKKEFGFFMDRPRKYLFTVRWTTLIQLFCIPL